MDTKKNIEITRTVTFKKNCRCHGMSATNRWITKQETRDNAWLSVITFLPIPSCCECDEPWIPMTEDRRVSSHHLFGLIVLGLCLAVLFAGIFLDFE